MLRPFFLLLGFALGVLTPVSPAGESALCKPTPVSPAGLLGMGTSHPLTPSRKARELKAHPFLYGRGMLFYTLIPKGGLAAPL